MQSLSVANKLLPGILFLLLAAFAPLPPCVAVTIEEIYDDDDGEGFLDETELTQTQKDFLSQRGNDAETLGEARKNAFEHATSLLESTLTNTNTIRIGVEFVRPPFSSQEDPNNQGECLITTGTFTAALTGPRGYGYPDSRFDGRRRKHSRAWNSLSLRSYRSHFRGRIQRTGSRYCYKIQQVHSVLLRIYGIGAGNRDSFRSDLPARDHARARIPRPSLSSGHPTAMFHPQE